MMATSEIEPSRYSNEVYLETKKRFIGCLGSLYVKLKFLKPFSKSEMKRLVPLVITREVTRFSVAALLRGSLNEGSSIDVA